uniref:LAGLIDADG endonuclease n=1 Tax=Coniophora puteana TaxID=80637 RepID=A0A896Z6I4_9AGAM
MKITMYSTSLRNSQRMVHFIGDSYTNLLEYRKNYHTNSNDFLHPQAVTGFTDAEGTFNVHFRKTSKTLVGWLVTHQFKITLHIKDKDLILKLREFFGVGNISINSEAGTASIYITNLEQLTNVIIPHFLKYPLVTQKQADFILFKEIIEQKKQKEHLKLEGLIRIFMLRKHLNLGLSAEAQKFLDSYLLENPNLASEFVVTRPVIKPTTQLEPHWVSGFVSGDGSFFASIRKTNKTKIGFRVTLSLSVELHIRELDVLESLKSYFKCGNVNPGTKRNLAKYSSQHFINICDMVIPQFKKYSLIGVKAYDFNDFCKIADLMKSKDHLTESGFNQIKEIVSTMNMRRPFDTNLDESCD